MAENQQLNLYRIKTEYLEDNVLIVETFHMAACTLESAITMFRDNGITSNRIISVEEIRLEAGNLYDL